MLISKLHYSTRIYALHHHFYSFNIQKTIKAEMLIKRNSIYDLKQ